MEFDLIAVMILFLIIIVVGIGLVEYFGTSVKTGVPAQIKVAYEKFVDIVFQKSPYNICEAYNGERVSIQDFQTLLQAIYSDQCGISTSNITMSFSISKDDMARIALLAGIANNGKLIFYNTTEPFGIGAILVKGNAGFYPIKFDDQIQLSLVGQPKGDLLIKQIAKGCDPYDEVCDQSCIYRKLCDPLCDDGKKHDIPCNLACIDVNRNKTIDIEDARERIEQNKCNPDCYVNHTNPYKAYDPGCVWKFKTQNDDVCDPNSQGITDAVCDPDCVNSKNICDPDCDGQVGEGNPYGLYDQKCYVCDGTCNGWCSPVCNKDAPEGVDGYDPDCKREKDKNFFCSGDLFCDAERGETCANSVDCPGGGVTCSDYNPQNVCCPQASDADFAGCSPTIGLKEGDLCVCGSQCEKDLYCEDTSHCCPEGKNWNGTTCVAGGDVLIVALKTNLKAVYSDDQISQLENKIGEYIKSLAKDGLSGTLLYLDEDKTSNLIGSKVTSAGDWNNIDGVLDQLLPKTKAKYLLIVGGYKTFPQPEVSVGACADPNEATFQSDDVYADYTKDYVPEIPVGRIPDPNGGDINVLLNSLDTYTNLHNSGGLDLSDKYSIIMELAFQGCRKASSGICFNKDAFNTNCFSSVCHDSSTSYTTISGHKLFNLLMHGDIPSPQPFMDDPCNSGRLFMTSTQVSSLNVKDSVWLMMPCYSSYIKNKQQSSDSVPIEFLKYGGAVYFGGTLTQFGGIMDGNSCPNVPGGDYMIGTLYALVVKDFSVGNTIGKAYLTGKIAYSNIQASDSETQSCMFRQLHENLMYGDPTLKIKNV